MMQAVEVRSRPAAVVSADKTDQAGRNLWPVFAAVGVVAIILAAIRWSLAHPFGIHWDEAMYLDQAAFDAQRLRSGMLLRLSGRIFIHGSGIAPAYRLLALPFLGAFGFHTTLARLVSLGCYALTALFIYLATRRIGGRAAGALAALVFCLSPEVVSASIFFGTDAPLYLATAAMLYYMFVCWTSETEPPGNWIGLGLAIGLGFLAKASFAAICFPVLAYWFAIGRWSRVSIPSLTSQRKAGVLAFLVAAPWWVLNLKPAVAFTGHARGFIRKSLGSPSLATGLRWLNTVWQGMLGHGTSLLMVLVVVGCVAKLAAGNRAVFQPMQRLAFGACTCAGLPIMAAQLSGTNHLLRHISPAMVPIGIGLGLLADGAGWTSSMALRATAVTLLCGQLLMLLWPVFFPNRQPADLGFANTALPWRVMSRFDQWDWEPIRELSYRCGLGDPNISYLGGGRAIDPPQIQFPWVTHVTREADGTLDYPNVNWLWRYEDGPIDWKKVMDAADHSDIVLTPPGYIGETRNEENLDNRYNAEFADRLSQEALFQTPVTVEMGRFEPVKVEIFVKKTLSCRN